MSKDFMPSDLNSRLHPFKFPLTESQRERALLILNRQSEAARAGDEVAKRACRVLELALIALDAKIAEQRRVSDDDLLAAAIALGEDPATVRDALVSRHLSNWSLPLQRVIKTMTGDAQKSRRGEFAGINITSFTALPDGDYRIEAQLRGGTQVALVVPDRGVSTMENAKNRLKELAQTVWQVNYGDEEQEKA